MELSNNDIILKEKNVRDKLISSEIELSKKIQKAEVCMEIVERQNYIPVFTLGNISVIKGKAKTRKTFAITMLLSAMAYKEILYNKFCNRIIDSVVLLFDTEQSEYYVYKEVERVSLIRNEYKQSSNFYAFCLRQYDPRERLEIIEYCLYNLSQKYKLGFVVIDGIRDLLYDINSQEEATKIVSKLLKWTKELNIHICNIIHENKADSNARGHIGTEITNKCESVLLVEKSKQNKDYSIIKSDLMRGLDFDDIAFTIKVKDNDKYIPIIEDFEPEL